MGYAIIDLNANYKGIKRVTQVTPTKPSSFINNVLNSIVFDYNDITKNILDIKSIVITPANSTAYYRFATTNRSDLILDTVTGRITLLGGFTGGKVTIYAKNSQGETVGTCVLNNLPAVDVDTYASPNVSKLSYSDVESDGGSSTPSYTYSYTKNGDPVPNGKDATKSFELLGTYSSDVSIDSNTGVVTFGEYSDTTQDRQVTVRMTITLPGNVTAYKDATVTQTRQGTQPEEHSITLEPYSSEISVNLGTSSVWDITVVGVGALSVNITGADADKFTTNISNNKLTVTTSSTNTSGSNYTATITVGDGTYSSSAITIVQPYMTYYISSVEYQGDPVQIGSTDVYAINPIITVKNSNGGTLSQTYSDLSVYNAIPGAEHYTVSSVKYPALYGMGVVDTTTGAIKFDKTTSGPIGLQYICSNSISYTTSNSAHTITYNTGNYLFATKLYDFNAILDWQTVDLSTETVKYGCSRSTSQPQDYVQLFYTASSSVDYIIDLGAVTAKLLVYLQLTDVKGSPITSDITQWFTIVETNNSISTMNKKALTISTGINRVYNRWIDEGGQAVVKVQTDSSHLLVYIYNKNGEFSNGELKYKKV